MEHGVLSMLVKIALVAVILIGMIVVLLGINHYMLSDRSDTDEEARKLREDVESSKSVISSHSLFHRFLPRPLRRDK